MPDGLVRIENAYVTGAPRAHVHRSHSGPFGIVNSEEGFQNLSRFLFGDISVNGVLEIGNLPLPPVDRLQKLLGTKVGYYFEVAVATRGALDFDLTRRTVANNSAILRSRSELFADDGTLKADARHPHLFSTFLDLSKRPAERPEMMFTIQLAVSMITYTGEEAPRDDHYVPGEYLFRDTVVISAIPPADTTESWQKDDTTASWQISFVLADSGWSSAATTLAEGKKDEQGQPYVAIPLENAKGFKAVLRLYGSHWV